jgi:microcin C transport system substrate-binding protein
LIRLELPDESPSGAQGFFFNMRRSKFADPRVRKALDYAFDYEWTNANLFFGLYKRTHSYFENSELKATGMPSPAELALLEPYRSKLPAEVFGEPYAPPVTDGSGQDRKVLGEASRLLTEAGWAVKGGKRVNAKGEVLTVEFLITPEPTSERLISPYVQNLLAIGVQASIRRVDPAQYELRPKTFDFDIITRRTIMSLTPGIELQNYFGSEAADIPGSRNITGIKNPVLDALVVKVMEAKSRDELVTAVRAMDRVLRAGHYWVPHWYKAAHHIAHWDKFGRPAVKPKYDRGILDTWWFDAKKAAALVR